MQNLTLTGGYEFQRKNNGSDLAARRSQKRRGAGLLLLVRWPLVASIRAES